MPVTNDTKIAVVTFPVSKSGSGPLLNLAEVLLKRSNNPLYVITGNEGSKVGNIDARVRVTSISHRPKQHIFSRGIAYAITQLRISVSILKVAKSVDAWLFFVGGELLIFPIVSAKLTRKPVILLFAGSPLYQSTVQKNRMRPVIFLISTFNRLLCENLIVYSPMHISEWNLGRYRHKILIAHRHYLDFETFTVTTPLPDRPALVGYIGRLSGEKGVQHFVQALPAILSDRQDLSVLIGGDGQLKETIEATLQEQGVSASVELPGWISHDDLPRYLNQLRLLVLPSYTEGLPNIMLEAMACGTPVLATPVGAVPDVIVDGVTGFIMENNSLECIAENVNRALNSPDLERIAEDGRRFVEEHFTFERVVARWKEVLEEV
ncbi:D-inositol-3-phosphate glycosyltransferase [anaerobic digester metagenome]